MSAASTAAAFVRRRLLCGCGGAARHYTGLLRWSVSVPRHHLSSAAPAAEIIQQKIKKPKPGGGGGGGGGVNIPWLMLSSPAEPQSRFLYRLSLDDHQFKLDKVLDLPEIAGSCCIGVSSQGHMLTVPARCSPDAVAINPLTKSRLALPPTSGLPDLHIHGSEGLIRAHNALFDHEKQVTVDSNYLGLLDGRAFLSPSLDTIVIFRRHNLYYEPFYAFCFSSSSSSPWIRPDWQMTKLDCVFHRGQFLAVDDAGNIVSITEFGPRPLYMPRNVMLDIRAARSVYLVETPDREELFLVKRGWGCSPLGNEPTFEVLWLDKNDKYHWKHVDSLGGLTFFVGANLSVSVLAADFPGLRSDSIYFTEDAPYDHIAGPAETGVFHLREDSVQFFQFTGEEIQLNWPLPMWYAPIAC